MTNEKTILDELILDEKRELFEQLLIIDKSIPKTIEEVLKEVESFNPSLFAFWDRQGLKPKLTTYILHYLIPFNELLRAEEKENTKVLTALLLSCFAWRTFDNCIDGHESNRTAHAVSLQSCLQLIEYSQSNFTVDTINPIQSHYNTMSEISLQEMETPIQLTDIWKRCSIFLFAPVTLASLNENSISIFKNYLNYTGLAHDLTDLISDIAGGIISLPLQWLKESSDYNLLNVQAVSRMNQKAKDSVKPLEDFFTTKELQNEFPLMNYFFMQAYSLIHKS